MEACFRTTQIVKIEFPRFNGENFDDRIVQYEQFFIVDRTSEDDRVKIAVSSLKGEPHTGTGATLKSWDTAEAHLWPEHVEAMTSRFNG